MIHLEATKRKSEAMYPIRSQSKSQDIIEMMSCNSPEVSYLNIINFFKSFIDFIVKNYTIYLSSHEWK